MKRKAEQYLVIDYLREMTERIKQECKASSLGGCGVPVLRTQGNPFSSRPSPSFLRPLLAWRLRMVSRFFNFIHCSGTVPWRSAPSSFSGMTCHNHHGSVLEFRTFKYLKSQTPVTNWFWVLLSQILFHFRSCRYLWKNFSIHASVQEH